VRHRSQEVAFDLQDECKNEAKLIKEMLDPGSFQGVFATLPSIFKSLFLCRYHSEVLLRSSLYRAKEKGIRHADIRLLT